MRILVMNWGSSSLKYVILDPETGHEALSGNVEEIGLGGVDDHGEALTLVTEHMQRELGDDHGIDAVGHRVVHGGEKFSEPTLVTPDVIKEIEALSPLAPLHNPAAASGLRAVSEQWPELPQVVVFDTAFHRTMPEKAWRYAIPDVLYKEHGVRRYGFHGTSHEYVANTAAATLGITSAEFNGIVAHLGNGASVTAIRNGKSYDTSMGYTPLAGLVMGTRSGDLDPSVVTQLIERGLYTADELDVMLNKRSGLLGLAGRSHMKEVVDAAATNPEAQLALDVAAYRLQKYIGAYHVAIGGADSLVFTGGIGENSAPFRDIVCKGLAPLGIEIDENANNNASTEPTIISTEHSTITVMVVATDEEVAIAKATAHLLSNL
ncbi:acetate kinase [Pseudoglutamicibacter albus]|uniref:Acetate kinase n=1 Tax=Pseudoglutamicibacter albus TaxID=98671 RepID=A0ABU1Z1Z1_9MICC|nr:acetate kinase [Pseudoglutamicibacter albus]MDR7294644.1 acetate kinase [Pseudoglutamicibacter albus]